MEQEHVMLDLETLSVRGDAAVLSVGAVRFDAEEVELDEHELTEWVDEERMVGPNGMMPSVRAIRHNAVHFGINEHGGYRDFSTFMWWLQQPLKAQQAVLELPRYEGSVLVDALEAFRDWVGDCPVWGNGASFDCAIIRNLYLRHGVPCWEPWQDRCYRTWKQGREPLKNRVGIHHHALADALNQALHMVELGGF